MGVTHATTLWSAPLQATCWLGIPLSSPTIISSIFWLSLKWHSLSADFSSDLLGLSLSLVIRKSDRCSLISKERLATKSFLDIDYYCDISRAWHWSDSRLKTTEAGRVRYDAIRSLKEFIDSSPPEEEDALTWAKLKSRLSCRRKS